MSNVSSSSKESFLACEVSFHVARTTLASLADELCYVFPLRSAFALWSFLRFRIVSVEFTESATDDFQPPSVVQTIRGALTEAIRKPLAVNHTEHADIW